MKCKHITNIRESGLTRPYVCQVQDNIHVS